MRTLFLILICSPAFSQIHKTVDSSLKSKAAVLQMLAISPTNELMSLTGMALIMSNNTFLTDAHVVLPDSITITHLQLRYGFTDTSFKFVNINVESEDYINQLSSSKYFKNNFCADFIELPIGKNIGYPIPVFDTFRINNSDRFYVVGPKEDLVKVSELTPLYGEIFKECQLLYFLGEAKQGHSGTPVYTATGEVIGLVQGGYESFEQAIFDKKLKNGSINQKQYDSIKNGYESNKKVGYFIMIKSVLQRLNDGGK